jgi:hypothetical protein
MKQGDYVITPHGNGVLVRKDTIADRRLERWVVRMNSFDGWAATYRQGIKSIQEKQGGVCFFRDELRRMAEGEKHE